MRQLLAPCFRSVRPSLCTCSLATRARLVTQRQTFVRRGHVGPKRAARTRGRLKSLRKCLRGEGFFFAEVAIPRTRRRPNFTFCCPVLVLQVYGFSDPFHRA